MQRLADIRVVEPGRRAVLFPARVPEAAAGAVWHLLLRELPRLGGGGGAVFFLVRLVLAPRLDLALLIRAAVIIEVVAVVRPGLR